MPPGDAAQNAPSIHRDSENPPSDRQPEAPSPTRIRKATTMTPKSSAITARTNYISPYRQTPVRSASTPVVRSHSSASTGSPNFKDIINRFNTKQDEKIPVPTNRIPASTVGVTKSRRTPATRPQGSERRTNTNRASAQASQSRQVRADQSVNGKTPRTRRPSNTGESEAVRAGRSLPPLQTSFTEPPPKVKEHRRSLSALDAHSPSAASLADIESDATSITPHSLLRHRRSHSNIESSTSTESVVLDQDLSARPRKSPLSPRDSPRDRSGIPTPSRQRASQASRISGHPKKPPAVQVLVSPHGSRRSSHPIKSPNLTAYISSPLPKKSPPLRSSRQRLPTAASTSTHASRQRAQAGEPSSTRESRHSRSARGPVDDSKRREPKKKIPELGAIDFAARRARIQSAFTKSLKEDETKGSKDTVRKEAGKRDPSHDTHAPEGNTNRDAVAETHANGRLRNLDQEGIIAVLPTLGQPDHDPSAEGHPLAPVNADAKIIPTKAESTPPDNTVFINQAPSGGVETDFSGEDKSSPRISLTTVPVANASVELPSPLTPVLVEPRPKKHSSIAVDTSQAQDDDITPKPGEVRHRVSVVITPESPCLPTVLSQVSNMLRSSPVEWSTDSEASPDSPVTHRAVTEVSNQSRSKLDQEVAAGPDETLDQPVSQPTSLSPLVGTATSDDRATIASIFNHYDEPREDFLRTYVEEDSQGEQPAETEMETVTETETETDTGHETHGTWDEDETETCDGEDTEQDEHSHYKAYEHDYGDEFTSCSELPDSGRPSMDTTEGWVTELESPQNIVHPLRKAPFQVPDTPTTPRQTTEFGSPRPPTPPPKDVAPPPPEKDERYSPPESSTFSEYSGQTGSMYLPEIETDSEPLGLAIQALPSHYDFHPGNRTSSYNNEDYYNFNEQDRQASYESNRSSFDQHGAHRPIIEYHPPFPGRQSPSSSFHSGIDSRRTSSFTGTSSIHFAGTPTTSMSTLPSMASTATAKTKEDLKRIQRRRRVLMEIVDTESVFFRDMTVAEEIYKGSANACSSITSDDIKVLFGNTDAIVQFSKSFLDVLKSAIQSVYVVRRSQIGGGPPDSTEFINDGFDDGLSEEERDRKTLVGEAFRMMLHRMEKVYGDYCKNHDAAAARLQRLEGNKGVAIWLQECKTCAEDLTNAWNLESLLIKPVQRVLKYPLLLLQLLDCTLPDHPDFDTLQSVAKEMKYVAGRIDEMKKRKDMVEKIVSRKRNESDLRHGITKGFARRAEKLRQSVGLSEVVVDEHYNRLFENYNMHFVQVQVIARDVEIYVSDIQGHVDKFIAFTRSFRGFGDVIPTRHPQTESKWKQLDSAMQEIATTYLQEHKRRVRKHAIEPLETLLKMHENPQIVMTKRNKKAVDYARYKAILDKGETPDKKTKELADAYIALNETLIEELPRLFVLTKKLVDAVLLNFVDLQAQWMNDWVSKLRMTFIDFDIPEKAAEVVRQFAGGFTHNDELLSQLSICNGTLNSLQFPSTHFLSPGSGLSSFESLDASSSRRPRTAEPSSPGLRERAFSLANPSPTASSFDRNERRHSGGATIGSSAALSIPPGMGHSQRARSNSAIQPYHPQPQRAHSANVSDSTAAAQASFFGTSNERPPLSRAAATAAARVAPLNLGGNARERSPSPPLPSAAFSSAMPMEDDRARDSASQPQSRTSSRNPSRAPSRASSKRALTVSGTDKAMFVAASLYEFNIDKERREAGFPYLTYVQGEIFDVIGVKGEIWLARNQDDSQGEIGWIWCKHFARLPET